MYSSGQVSRPPSPRPLRHSLTIRTTIKTEKAKQPAALSSPVQQTYPIPIPTEKRDKALQLYLAFKLEEQLAQSQRDPQSAISYNDGYHLSVPGPPTARSITSQASSRRHKAASTSSAYGAMTELSSVVSFDDESPSSAKARTLGELVSFDGKKIRQRTRKKLNPTARAKAALVRWLGSCAVCRARRVPCPFEHHDIDCLEKLRLSAADEDHADIQNRSQPSVSGSSQGTARSTSGGQQQVTPIRAQTDALFGIGGNPQLLEISGNFDPTHLDIQSPGGAYESQTQIPAPATHYYLPESNLSVPVEPPNPYADYQDGQMIALGVLRGFYYYCQHIGGCEQFFDDAEKLQAHFETSHFAFTRIDPAHRYMCSLCTLMNPQLNGPCLSCGATGSMEIWICGNFIATQEYQRHAPDGTDLLGYTPSASSFYTSSFVVPGMDFRWDDDVGNDFGGGTNSGPFNFQDGNAYGGPGNHGYDYDPSQGSDAGSYQFQGGIFGGSQHMRQNAAYSHRVLFKKAQRNGRHHTFLLLSLLLVIITILGVAHNWILSTARIAIPQATTEFRENSCVMGFVGIVASFMMSLSMKHLTVQRFRRAKFRYIFPSDSFKKTSIQFQCTQTAPEVYLRGDVIL